MATLPAAHALILLLLLLLAAPAAESATDSSDDSILLTAFVPIDRHYLVVCCAGRRFCVGFWSETHDLDLAAQALTVLYSSLNSPPQLSGWTSNGGDPCGGGSWKGISCSGSAVTTINLAGLGLNGTLGYLLSNLLSLKTLDMSSNSIHDTIPYQLPPNLTYMYKLSFVLRTTPRLKSLFNSHGVTVTDSNLANNKFSGNLPYSISKMFSLNYLYLQDNQLTGSVNVLANLSLNTLNIANNNFSGWIPQEFKSIPNLVIEGNSFTNNPAPPPPPFVPPPP
ncbi:Protein STRUBBELIG-RECEPTOR FAMILY 8, partial [Ananas comosus]